MGAATVPASADEALDLLDTAYGYLAVTDPAQLPDEAVARVLRRLERGDAVQAAVRGRYLQAFDVKDAHLADGHRTTRGWLVHSLRITRGQAAEYKAEQALARDHRPLVDALVGEYALTKSVALQLAKWTRSIPDQFREQAEEILVAAAQAGAGLRGLAAICAEIR